MFIRQMQLTLADRFICVTSKFNQTSSDYIGEVISQLQHQPGKQITPNNRYGSSSLLAPVATTTVVSKITTITTLSSPLSLPQHAHPIRLLVVHNLKDVADEEVLNFQIQEVSSFYQQQVTKDGTNDKFVPLVDTELGVRYYQAIYTEHVFLVQHTLNQEDWRFKHNSGVFRLLKRLLRCDPRPFCMLKEFVKAANQIIPSYLEEAQTMTGFSFDVYK
eukprot:TRINITY_DN474_c0_g2_i15.p1 TRINITY_DN474_c0_g2~~TRINITY_DN474_c0_g2_i15.p1  ORF type:complete len:218 (+),score=36.13 TRINITY_DN474_c0_g2_i15:725-1378(+)